MTRDLLTACAPNSTAVFKGTHRGGRGKVGAWQRVFSQLTGVNSQDVIIYMEFFLVSLHFIDTVFKKRCVSFGRVLLGFSYKFKTMIGERLCSSTLEEVHIRWV
jgi:hypothetical protein